MGGASRERGRCPCCLFAFGSPFVRRWVLRLVRSSPRRSSVRWFRRSGSGVLPVPRRRPVLGCGGGRRVPAVPRRRRAFAVVGLAFPRPRFPRARRSRVFGSARSRFSGCARRLWCAVRGVAPVWSSVSGSSSPTRRTTHVLPRFPRLVRRLSPPLLPFKLS